MAREHVERDARSTDIAVIGMACKFPGADDVREFWNNLRSGVYSVGEIPADRWDWRNYFGDPQTQKNKCQSKWGGFIRHADRFEAEFFSISPREAAWIDPQQRQALELSWQCLEDAGYKPSALAGANIGVYVGACNYDYKTLQDRNCATIEGHVATGNFNAIIANRVSYFYNFHGPSLAVDTACASSLVALQQAVAALRAGDCEAALVGGVALLATPDRYLAFGSVGMLSATGACRTFDADADGYVRSEGAGFVMLKPLVQALADGDHVLGVIKGIAVNHGGRVRSLTAPSALSQAQVITAALHAAQVTPDTITYVETHGTGTPLGDPIEVHGLTRAFERHNRRNGAASGKPTGYCALGAVKTNVGHLEAAAGMAGLIKVLLAMRHRQIPGNLHFEKLNPRIQLEGSPFYIADRLRDWTPALGADGHPLPLRAGVSSFGFGGVNSHVVLEEAPAALAAEALVEPPRGLHVLALSARTEASLHRMAEQYAERIEEQPHQLAAICRRANTARDLLSQRLALSARSAEDMAAQLRHAATAAPGAHASRRAPVVGFLFTGQGSQYAGMGRALYDTLPVFRAAFDRCDELLAPLLGCSVHSLVFGDASATLNQTRHTQPALFALAYALAEVWKACGVTPQAVMGHSVGEIAAACVAGMLSLEHGAQLISARARLMESESPAGAMATVFAPVADVTAFIEQRKLPVCIAAVNAADSTVISGDRSAMADAVQLMVQHGLEAKPLQVERAFHSELMDGMQAPFRAAIASLQFQAPRLEVISNVTGEPMTAEQVHADYWVDHVRQPVLFHHGLQAMRARGVDVFIELGPSPTLLKLARRTLGAEVALLPSIDPQQAGTDALAVSLAKLHALGVDVNFEPLYPDGARAWAELPPYPFDGDSYWAPPAAAQPFTAAAAHTRAPAADPLLGHRIEIAGEAAAVYGSTIDLDDPALAYLVDHCVANTPLMPGAAFVSLGVSAAQSTWRDAKGSAIAVFDVQFLQALPLATDRRVQTKLHAADAAGASLFEVWSALPEGDAPTEWTLHARGCLRHEASPLSGHASRSPDTGIEIDRAAFYRSWQERGVAYGPAFQGLQRLARLDDQVIADVRLPQEGLDASGCPPALLDAIWQSVLPLLPDAVQRQRLLPLPTGLASIVIAGRLPSVVSVVARPAAASGDPHEHRFDLDVCSADGQLVARIDALALRPVAALPGLAAHDPLPCYEPVWRRVEITSASTSPAANDGTALVVYATDSAPLATRLIDELRLKQSVMDLDVDAARRTGGPDALAAFAQRVGPVQRLYFLAGLELAGADATPGELVQTQQRGVLALFELLKHLRVDAKGLALSVVANRTQAVDNTTPMQPWSAAAFGLAAVYGNEHAQAATACVDLDLPAAPSTEQWDAAARQVLAEPCAREGRLVAYRDGRRMGREVQRVELPAATPVYRDGGVYLIVGGAGGLGAALSRHLAQRHQARLVWVGRSPLDASRQQLLDEVQALGGTVVYHATDACDADAMRRVVLDTLDRFGAVHGVFHAALSLHDRSLANMDLAGFHATFDAKVLGSLALYRAVQDQPLDFFALFSSVVSLLGHRGQANYVAASAVQDAFAHHLQRKGVRARVFNWGRWGEIGAVASDAFTGRLDAEGIRAIAPDEGVALIETVLGAPATQVIPVRADAPVLAAMGVAAHATARWVPTRNRVDLAVLTSQLSFSAGVSAVPDDVAVAAGYAALNELARRHVHAAFDELLGGQDWPDGATTDALQSRLGVVDAQRRCFEALLQSMQRDGVIVARDGVWRFTGALSRYRGVAQLKARHDALIAEHAWLAPELRLLAHCAPALPDVLRGRVAGTAVLFPQLSMQWVEPVYCAGPIAVACNQRVAALVAASARALAEAEPGRTLRVLEIGAGTGGTTRGVLQALDDVRQEGVALEYVYTDVSAAFLHHGREQVAQGRPYLRYEVLDIEKPLAPQGFKPGDHDIVIASNVLHATRALTRTLQNVKQLLREGGQLVLNEVVQAQDFLTITFGMLEGWWLSEDRAKRLADAPLLAPSLWQSVLGEEGFRGADSWRGGAAWPQAVLTAISDGRYLTIEQAAVAAAPATPAPVTTRTEAARVTAADVLAAPGTSGTGGLATTVTAYLRAELAEVLQLRADRFDQPGRPLAELYLSELGMDSLTAMDLRNRLLRQLALDVPVEKLLGGTRIQALVELLSEKLLVQRLVSGDGGSSASDAAEDMETFTL